MNRSTTLPTGTAPTGAFHVVSGELTEQTLRRGPGAGLTGRRYPGGTTRPFHAAHVHQVTNTGIVPAISVHVYSPALTSMTRYRLYDGVLHVAEVERAGADW